jgi:hypothetical protein
VQIYFIVFNISFYKIKSCRYFVIRGGGGWALVRWAKLNVLFCVGLSIEKQLF